MKVQCKVVKYEPCIKCGVLEPTMVKIGVFAMCTSCWEKEFNVTEIPIDSEKYQIYVKWLQQTEYAK